MKMTKLHDKPMKNAPLLKLKCGWKKAFCNSKTKNKKQSNNPNAVVAYSPSYTYLYITYIHYMK